MSPKNATEIGQRRHYEWGGERFPSVTTLLKAWPMEWAIAYGAKHVAERAVFDFAALRERLNSDDPLEMTLRWLKAAPAERRDAAADAGTDLHVYLEQRLQPFDPWAPPETSSPAEEAIEQFLQTYRPEPVYVESQVFSVSEKYAGSADAFLDIYGKRYVFDLKTGAVDHKARLQLAAYRYGDFIGEDDREIGPVPVCDGALILSVPRDDPKSWRLLEVEAGPAEFRRFLDFARAFRWYDETKKQAVGEILLPQSEGGDAA